MDELANLLEIERLCRELRQQHQQQELQQQQQQQQPAADESCTNCGLPVTVNGHLCARCSELPQQQQQQPHQVCDNGEFSTVRMTQRSCMSIVSGRITL